MDSYRSVAKAAQAETIEKKSVFTTYVSPAASEAEALAFVSEASGRNANAGHNVYAYRVGLSRTDEKYSDAGEPSGTAGLPALSVLRKEGIINVAVVIARFFGGILLGASGLVRAYSGACKAGIDAAGIAVMRLTFVYGLTTPYTYAGKIAFDAPRIGFIIANTTYGEHVTITARVLADNAVAFERYITETTNGEAVVERTGSMYTC